VKKCILSDIILKFQCRLEFTSLTCKRGIDVLAVLWFPFYFVFLSFIIVEKFMRALSFLQIAVFYKSTVW